MFRTVPIHRFVAGAAAIACSGGVAGQLAGQGLVVPVPAASEVTMAVDTFVSSDGVRRRLDVYRAAGARGTTPVVIFVNGSGPGLRTAQGYVDWARLVTSRGLAAVLYERPAGAEGQSFADNLRLSIADLDSVVMRLGRRGNALHVDGSNVVLWAGSSQTTTGTPFALGSARPAIKGYVLYYGSGEVQSPRADVPVFVARAGLDALALNRTLDSLTYRLTQAGVPLTVVNYPAGQHGFDIFDNSEMTTRVITQTLDFMVAVTRPSLQQAIAAGLPYARATVAFNAQRWPEAERLYSEIMRAQPSSRSAAWRLGLAQLANNHPAEALASFDRARELGQGGARDIGLPAARAAIRAGQTNRAIEWLQWALRSFPRIRAEIEADAELAPLLRHPLMRSGGLEDVGAR